MKASVVREMTTQELKDALVDERGYYSKTKMAHTISPIENPMNLKHSRKKIARLLTELRNREMQNEL